jgi:hypothetical protein
MSHQQLEQIKGPKLHLLGKCKNTSASFGFSSLLSTGAHVALNVLVLA